MPYVALKCMKVEGRRVLPGDPVPEAASWKNLKNYLQSNYLLEVPDGYTAGRDPDTGKIVPIAGNVPDLPQRPALDKEPEPIAPPGISGCLGVSASPEPAPLLGEMHEEQPEPAKEEPPKSKTKPKGRRGKRRSKA